MGFVSVEIENRIAVATMARDKVNAFGLAAVDDLAACFEQLAEDGDTGAVVLTGRGKFFSFGFDVPELLTYSKDRLHDFLVRFSRLATQLYLFPKPVVAAINGHATAGGCMLALTADHRVMVDKDARISLNEINIGVPVFAGPVAMLVGAAGHRNAELVLSAGRMYLPEEAKAMHVVDDLVPAENVLKEAIRVATEHAARNPDAFCQIKRLLREPIAEAYRPREAAGIDEFIKVWFSEKTQAQLRMVEIRR